MTLARIVIPLLAFSCGAREPSSQRVKAHPLGTRNAHTIEQLRDACGSGSFSFNEFVGTARCHIDDHRDFEVSFGSSWEVSRIVLSGYSTESDLEASNEILIRALVESENVEPLRRALLAPDSQRLLHVSLHKFVEDGRWFSYLKHDSNRPSRGKSPFGSVTVHSLFAWTSVCTQPLSIEATQGAFAVRCTERDWSVEMTPQYEVWRIRVRGPADQFAARARALIPHLFPENLQKAAEDSLAVPAGPLNLNRNEVQTPFTSKADSVVPGPDALRSMTWEVAPFLLP